MSLNDKALLPDNQATDSAFALRSNASIIENGNGEWTSAAPLSAADVESAPQLSAYFHAVRRHWVLATALGSILSVSLGLAVYLLYGSRYTADAYLKCSLQEEILLPNGSRARVPTETEFDIFKNTQMQMMTNRMVLTSAWRNEVKVGEEKIKIANLPFLSLDQEPDPVDWLLRKVAVSFPQKAELMKVSVTTKDPVHSAAVVNAVVEAYLSEVVEAEQKRRDVRISDLKRIYIDKSQEVKDSLNELKKMAENLGTSESEMLTQQQKYTLEELSSNRAELLRSQFEVNKLRCELLSQQAVLATLENQHASDIDVQQAASYDPFLREIGTQLVIEEQMNEMARGAVKEGSKSRAAQQSLGRMGKMRQQYDARMDQLRGEVETKRRGEVERDIKKFEAAISQSVKQQAVIQEEVKRLRKEADRFGMSSIDMQMRREDIKSRQKSLDSIATELETLRVEANTAPRVTPMNPAEPPKTDSSRMVRMALTGMVAMLGFCSPFFCVVVWDMQSSRINGAADVADQLGLPVIGSVPKIPLRILHHQGSPKKNHQIWQLRLTESMDGISARLLRQAETEQRRVVMVTSAVNGEGKTTLAAQLAMSLARSGRRVLLVDFDLRHPTFDEVFGLPRSPGISEILRNECDLANCIHAAGMENLSVLTAGRWDRFALAALANHSVASMFKELREDYEFVIVDTSPILPIADTRFVSQYVDTVVLCVFRDVSQAPRIRAACEILEAFGVQSVEAVVTGVNDNFCGKRVGYYRSAETAAS